MEKIPRYMYVIRQFYGEFLGWLSPVHLDRDIVDYLVEQSLID